MGIRRQAREVAVQALYMSEFRSGSNIENDLSEKLLQDFYVQFGVVDACRDFSSTLILGTLAHLKKIDSIISSSSLNWPLVRMARVDRALLRVAVYELFYLGDIPHNVTINEAIEIAKKYSSEDAPMFINGVLDRIARTHTFHDVPNVMDFDDASRKAQDDIDTQHSNLEKAEKAATN